MITPVINLLYTSTSIDVFADSVVFYVPESDFYQLVDYLRDCYKNFVFAYYRDMCGNCSITVSKSAIYDTFLSAYHFKFISHSSKTRRYEKQ